MIVDDISVSKNNITINNLIMHMPYVNQRWKGFSLEIKGRTILPNDCITLCAIDAKSEKNRKKVLEALDGIEISIQFYDIYDNEYKCTKILNSKFFNSHFKYRAE